MRPERRRRHLAFRARTQAGHRQPVRRSGSAPRPTVLEWAVRYAVPLAGLAGAAIYGVLRLSYMLFYLHLRSTPEEVGYDYAEILAGQLIGAVELVLVLGAVFFTVTAIVHVVATVLGRLRRPRTTPRGGGRRSLPVRTTAARSAAAGAIVVCVGLPVLAWEEGAAAARGATVRNIYLYPLAIPVLPVQAVPATVHATEAAPSEALHALADRECLLYLGGTDGIVVLYDVSTKESLRVSSQAVLVSLRFTTGVPVGC